MKKIYSCPNYTIIFPEIGDYPTQLYCFDSSGNSSSEPYIHVTSTGRDNSLFIIILMFSLACFFLILTMFVNEEIFVYISGLLFLIIGIFTMIFGLEDLSDLYTRAISYITLGLGMLFTLGAYLYNSYSLRQDKEDEYEENFD